MRRGLIPWSLSQVNPMRSRAPGAKFSASTSALATSLVKTSLPPSVFRSRVRLRLLALSIVKYKLSTSGTSRSWTLVTSPRPGGSTLITSAPSQARNWVHTGPDWTWVRSTTVTPERALGPSALSMLTWASSSLLVHGLVQGSWGKGVRVNPDVDEGGPARVPGPSEGRADLLGVPHLFPVAIEHLGEQVVPDIPEVVAHLAPLRPVALDLPVADLVHVGVVAHHPDEGKPLAHHGLEVPAREGERPVPEERHHLLVRPGQLGGHGEGNPHAQRAERPGVHPVAWPARLDHPSRRGHNVPTVADEHRVLGQELVDLVSQAKGVDGGSARELARQPLLEEALLLGPQLLQPGPPARCCCGEGAHRPTS